MRLRPYTVPPDLFQLHQMLDTGARPAVAATAASGTKVGIVLVELVVVEQRYGAVKEVLEEGKGP